VRRFVFLSLVALVAILALWFWPGVLRRSHGEEGGTGPLRTSPVLRRDIGSTVLATGVIRPMVGAEVQVGSRVSGILQRLNVSIGDEVEAGQVLAELDPTEFQARYDQAAAAEETARVEERFAGIDLDRARELRAEGVISGSAISSLWWIRESPKGVPASPAAASGLVIWGATGPQLGKTKISDLALAAAPASSVTVRRTAYTPGSLYAWFAVAPEPVCPSPNSQ